MIISSEMFTGKYFAYLHQMWKSISFLVSFQFLFGYVSIQQNSLTYSRSDPSNQQWPDSGDKVRKHF